MEIPSLPENNIEKEIIEKSKELGPESPEVKKLLLEWTLEKEKEADAINTPRANVELNLARAKLYIEMGLKEDGIDNLYDVMTQANQEKHDDLFDEASKLLDKLGEEPWF